jgi:type I restriction-modification system DNA methylase subunit
VTEKKKSCLWICDKWENRLKKNTPSFRKKIFKKLQALTTNGRCKEIENIPEFCYSASFDEVAKKDFSLVPSKYIEFVNRDENIDFDEKMQTLKSEFADLLKAEAQSKNDLLTVFKELGYEIKL